MKEKGMSMTFGRDRILKTLVVGLGWKRGRYHVLRGGRAYCDKNGKFREGFADINNG